MKVFDWLFSWKKKEEKSGSIAFDTMKAVPNAKSKPHTNLHTWELSKMRDGKCPDCGGGDFYAGPSAGMMQNYYCANPLCGSGFNLCASIPQMSARLSSTTISK